MQYKKLLAYTLTKMLNSKEDAEKAQEYFEKTFQKKDMTGDIPTQKVSFNNIAIVNLLREINLASSNSEAKRLITEGAVEVNSQKITNPQQSIKVQNGMIIKVGKHKLVKLIK